MQLQLLTNIILAQMLHKYYLDLKNPFHNECWKDMSATDKQFWVSLADKLINTLKVENFNIER